MKKTEPSLEAIKVLVVDDEELVAQLNGDIVAGMGCQVTVLTDSRKALKLFQEDPDYFDLLITDHAMPNITGMELANRMRSIKPEIPIILCTGYASEVTEEQALALNINRFIRKPMSPANLRQHIEDIVREKASL